MSDTNNPFFYESSKINENEIQFYNGLKKEEVDPKYLKDFNAIDADGSGELSDKEVKEIASAQDEIDSAENELSEMQNNKKDL